MPSNLLIKLKAQLSHGTVHIVERLMQIDSISKCQELLIL